MWRHGGHRRFPPTGHRLECHLLPQGSCRARPLLLVCVCPQSFRFSSSGGLLVQAFFTRAIWDVGSTLIGGGFGITEDMGTRCSPFRVFIAPNTCGGTWAVCCWLSVDRIRAMLSRPDVNMCAECGALRVLADLVKHCPGFDNMLTKFLSMLRRVGPSSSSTRAKCGRCFRSVGP